MTNYQMKRFEAGQARIKASQEARTEALAKLSNTISADVKKAAVPPANDQVQDDEAHSGGREKDDLIRPIHHPLLLVQYIESSAELRQLVACMVANTVGYGWRVVPREHTQMVSEEVMEEEEIALENFFNYVNPDQDVKDVLTEFAWDYYLTGGGYFEISRSASNKKPDSLYRVPSHQLLMSRKEKKAHRFSMKQLHRTRDGYKVKRRFEHKRFRKFAQSPLVKSVGGVASSTKGTETVWFKEFQDNRQYKRDTGELVTKDLEIRAERKEQNLAHEMIYISTPKTRGAYGFPHFIGNVIALNGDIKAENINMATFSNNNIPSMVIKVSSGQLTAGSIDRLSQFAETKFQSDDNRSRFLLLESESLGEDGDETGKSKIDIQSLHQTAKEEMMYEKWMEYQRASLRRSFRIPAILVGRGEAISGDVVAATMKLADEQVFGQDREHFVSWINRRLLPELGIVHHKLKLNSPNVNDVSTLVEMLRASEKTGAMTPRIARQIIEQIMSTDYGDMPKDIDADVPFAITMAERVKKVNEAGMNNPDGSNDPDKEMNDADPSEPAQQFTSDPASS